MRILLPSQGLLGQRSISLRTPTFKDIYEVQGYSDIDFITKCRVLELVSNIDLSKVTECDVQHVFKMVAFALLNNQAVYHPECPKCGTVTDHTVSLGEQKIQQIQLRRNYFSKRVNTKKYEFILPSAKNVIEDYDTAQYEDDEENAFKDLTVARILNHPNDRGFAQSLPVSIYAAAFVYKELHFHGILPVEEVECPNCHHKYTFKFGVSSSVLEFKEETFFKKFLMVHDIMSFSDFMSLSIRGLQLLVSEINDKLDNYAR